MNAFTPPQPPVALRGEVDEAVRLPLATIAILSYNQERYILEAMRGAFTQTYQPLEIIFSDDCSSDRTFSIIQSEVKRYRGPHKVIVNRTSKNLGVFNHLISLAQISSGQLLIVNAGDDVSYPNRVQRLMELWNDRSAVAMSSGYDIIDEIGYVKKRNQFFPRSKGAQIVFGRSKIALKVDGEVLSVPGFCAAYDVDFLKSLLLCPHRLNIEDGTISGVVNCLGLKILQVRESLVQYRVHDSSLTVRVSSTSSEHLWRREQRISQMAEQTRLMIEQIVREVCARNIDLEPSVRSQLNRGLRYSKVTREFWNRSTWGRVSLLFECRSPEDLQFALSRVMGWRAFVFVRQVYHSLRAALPGARRA